MKLSVTVFCSLLPSNASLPEITVINLLVSSKWLLPSWKQAYKASSPIVVVDNGDDGRDDDDNNDDIASGFEPVIFGKSEPLGRYESGLEGKCTPASRITSKPLKFEFASKSIMLIALVSNSESTN